MTSRVTSQLPIGLAAIAGMLLAGGPAAAQVQSETLEVRARIGEACTVTSASLDFGQSLDLNVGRDAEGSIEILCQSETALNIVLSGAGLRFLSNGGTGFIEYRLFQDPARATLWDENTPLLRTISGSGSVPVYGTVHSQVNSKDPGLYTDNVTITFAF